MVWNGVKDLQTVANTKDVALEFCRKFSANLTTLEGEEHYFREEEYLIQMDKWIEKIYRGVDL